MRAIESRFTPLSTLWLIPARAQPQTSIQEPEVMMARLEKFGALILSPAIKAPAEIKLPVHAGRVWTKLLFSNGLPKQLSRAKYRLTEEGWGFGTVSDKRNLV